MKRKYFGALLGLAIASSAAALMSSSPEPEPLVRDARPKPSAAEAPRERAQPGTAESRGDQADEALHRYAVQVNNDFRPDASAPDAGGLLLSFEGELTLGEVANLDGISWLYVRPDALTFDAQAERGDGLSPEHRAQLEQELEQGYFVGRNESGQTVEYRFSRTPSSISQGFLRMIAVAIQRVTPADEPTSNTWTVAEVDTAGEARVRYTRDADGSTLKVKDAYTRLLTDTGLMDGSDQRTLHGEGKLSYAGARLTSASLVEHTTVRIDSSVMQNDAEVQIVARAGEVGESVAGLVEKLRRLPSVSAFVLPTIQERAESDVLREVLGNHSFEDLTGALAALPADDEPGRRSLLARFEADLKLNPEHAEALGQRMHGANERAQSMIVSALSNAETPESTAALRAISEDERLDEPARQTATAMLGFTREGDEETVSRLERASENAKDPHAHVATLALGNLADHARDADPDQSERIVDQLLARLRQARSTDEATGLLSALGNSGDARLVEALAPWFGAEDELVRAGAYYALRLLGTDAAAQTMARAALGDPGVEVRRLAMAGLAVKPSAVCLAAAQRALAVEPDPQVRLAALTVLSMFPRSESLASLSQVASHDADETVRSSAQSLLDRGA